MDQARDYQTVVRCDFQIAICASTKFHVKQIGNRMLFQTMQRIEKLDHQIFNTCTNEKEINANYRIITTFKE